MKDNKDFQEFLNATYDVLKDINRRFRYATVRDDMIQCVYYNYDEARVCKCESDKIYLAIVYPDNCLKLVCEVSKSDD